MACRSWDPSISIHTLRMEGDEFANLPADNHHRFQSTPSAWRVTSPVSPAFLPLPISIHTLRMEGDSDKRVPFQAGHLFQSTPSAWRVTLLLTSSKRQNVFQSTPSAWRVTDGVYLAHILHSISIHTLRMEGDRDGRMGLRSLSHFNPHPPHGG